MEGPDQHPPARPNDPGQLRVSDDDRHRVAEILREAAGEGRLDLAELDERLEAAYAAKTYADLVPITHDLPVQWPRPFTPPRGAVVRGPARERHLAIMSGVERRGSWVVPERMTVMALMGGASLDLRSATFAAREVVITVNAFMGGADIVVGPNTHVVMEGTGIMGGYSGPSGRVPEQLDESSVTVRIRGLAIWGGVSVSRKPLPGESRRELRRPR